MLSVYVFMFGVAIVYMQNVLKTIIIPQIAQDMRHGYGDLVTTHGHRHLVHMVRLLINVIGNLLRLVIM